ncbi:MAG: hypothetical protein ACJ8C4_07195 [Gemmataceae bacterium]
MCHRPTVAALAKDIDSLERHIERYGSIVAKQPDIWGQARLTKYRAEFEKEMFAEFGNFKETLQGSVSRSDQAYFANALALSAAISGEQAGAFAPRSRVAVQNNTSQQTVNPTAIQPADADKLLQTGVFAGFDSIQRSKLTTPLTIGFGDLAKAGIALEPTIQLDQKARYLDHLDQIRRTNEGDDTADSPGYSLNLVRIPVSVLPGKCTERGHGADITFTLTPYLNDELLPTTVRNLVINDVVDLLAYPIVKVGDSKLFLETVKSAANDPKKSPANQPQPRLSIHEPKAMIIQSLRGAKPDATKINAAAAAIEKNLPRPSANRRLATIPLSPTQVIPVLGKNELYTITTEICLQIVDHLGAQERFYLLEAQSALRAELNTSYEMLEQQPELWTCLHQISQAIRANDCQGIAVLRCQFLAIASKCCPSQLTANLAWAIVVESALLNDRLNRDMREASAAKGCACHCAEGMQFCLPGQLLTPEARHSFNEYVRCRWPIHVFALDPMSQDQNIADAYSRRQETQLALSLAFVSGNISARNMTRYARRLEKDMETIAINRTQIGFSHGEDTFGWRFYPRVQSPPFESNATSLFRDQLIGGPSKKAELRQPWLEPGMRECVAIVMMPSFVPYVTCESSTNWFSLANPKAKKLTTSDAVALGRAVKSIHACGTNIENTECYRDGDVARLLNKAHQLEARLPLQSAQVQVPYENTLGGFEMFNTGITDLAPQLRGWYGAPGASTKADTTLFLVGDHFSVHHTKVIAGGKECNFELISRQVMQVTIPKSVANNVRKEGGKATTNPDSIEMQCRHEEAAIVSQQKPQDELKSPEVPADSSATPTEYHYVDVHVATPYGVTAHLEIPTSDGGSDSTASVLNWGQDNVEVVFMYGSGGVVPPAVSVVRPPLTIKGDITKTTAGLVPAAPYKLTLTFSEPVKIPYAKPFTKDVSIENIPASAFDRKKSVLTVPADMVSAALFKAYGNYFGPRDINPPVPLKLEKATIQSTNTSSAYEAVQIAGDLTVLWLDATAGHPTPCGTCATALPPFVAGPCAEAWHTCPSPVPATPGAFLWRPSTRLNVVFKNNQAQDLTFEDPSAGNDLRIVNASQSKDDTLKLSLQVLALTDGAVRRIGNPIDQGLTFVNGVVTVDRKDIKTEIEKSLKSGNMSNHFMVTGVLTSSAVPPTMIPVEGSLRIQVIR